MSDSRLTAPEQARASPAAAAGGPLAAVDVREISPGRNYGAGGAPRVLVTPLAGQDGAIWRALLLQAARDIAAREGGAARIIEVSGPDAAARAGRAEGPVVFVVTADLGQLADPRPLLAGLRTQLLQQAGHHLLVAAPLERSADGEVGSGWQSAVAHFRQWTGPELERLLVAAGFEIKGRGPLGGEAGGAGWSWVEAACTPGHYAAFLAQAGLCRPSAAPRHLLVTTEYAGLHRAGGIGAFVRAQRDVYGHDQTLCLYLAEPQGCDPELLRGQDVVAPSMVLDAALLATLPVEEQALLAVQQLLLYFPGIETVQYGDYEGVGCRLAQARQAGMLPPHLTLVVHCHGATHYLENGNEHWYGAAYFGTAEREKISIEQADIATFPTAFLQTLYVEAGIAAPAGSVLMRYPYVLSAHEPVATMACDTLLFYGKRSVMKGHGLFLRALVEGGTGVWRERGLRRLVFVGSWGAGEPGDEGLLDELRQDFTVEEHAALGHFEAGQVLRENARRALCVMPYRADNHPYALLDAVSATALPVMLRAGGVPEMFPPAFHAQLLAAPDSASLRQRLLGLLALPLAALDDLRRTFLAEMARAQQAFNEQMRSFPPAMLRAVPARPGEVTVIVPVFNTPVAYLHDLIAALNSQTLAPAEVILVDDASQADYAAELAGLVQRELQLPHRLLRHPVNQGLAAARNTGLAAVRTEFVANIDSDDVPLNDFLRDISAWLTAHADGFAAMPYLAAFDDGADFNRIDYRGYVYRPLGEGVIASQVDNQLGHANAGFRTSVLRELGGWDASSRAMWEDWALYLKGVSAGHRIGIIPKVGCLYRVHPKSMVRTYRVWPAMRRLALNMTGLSRYESFRLQAVARDYDELGKRARQREQEFRAVLADCDARASDFRALEAEQRAHIAALERELNRKSVRAVRALANRLACHGWLFRSGRWLGNLTWKIGRAVRRALRGGRN